MKNTKLLNIDWLTLSCSGGLVTSDPNVVVKQQLWGNGEPKMNNQYSVISSIYYKGQKVAVAESIPREGNVLPPDSVRLKIENRILYLRNAKEITWSLLKSFNLRFKQVSQIDIAMDFQKFDNGVLPENLIRKFIANKYPKVGKGKFKVIGSMKTVKHRLEYFTFGSQSTGKQMKLYNKTVELKEVKDKRYIRELWEMAGLTGKPVWRLELSVKGNQQKAIDTGTGEIKNVNLFKIFSPKFLEELFMSGVNSLFSFKKSDGGSNITRMKKLELFKDNSFSNLRLKKTVDAPNSTNYERGLISRQIRNLHRVPQDNFNLLQQKVNAIWHDAILYDLRDHALKKVAYHFPDDEELILRAFKIAEEQNVTDIDVLFESLTSRTRDF